MAATVWLAWGFIGAHALPDSALFDLGPDARIELPSPERLEQLRRQSPALQHAQPPFDCYYSAVESQIIVRGKHILWLRTRQASHSDAWDDIEHRLVPAVTAALAAYGAVSPRVEMLRVAKELPGGRIDKAITPWVGGTFGGFDTRALTVDEASGVRKRWTVAQRGDGAEAARLFHEAVENQDRSGQSGKAHANASLNYFLVVEHIALRVGAPPDKAGVPEGAGAVLEKLRDQLAPAVPVDRQLKALRRAWHAMGLLEVRFLAQKIERAGRELGLDQSVVAEALALAHLRSRALAHPGRRPEGKALGPSDAERIARHFLMSYLDKLAS